MRCQMYTSPRAVCCAQEPIMARGCHLHSRPSPARVIQDVLGWGCETSPFARQAGAVVRGKPKEGTISRPCLCPTRGSDDGRTRRPRRKTAGVRLETGNLVRGYVASLPFEARAARPPLPFGAPTRQPCGGRPAKARSARIAAAVPRGSPFEPAQPRGPRVTGQQPPMALALAARRAAPSLSALRQSQPAQSLAGRWFSSGGALRACPPKPFPSPLSPRAVSLPPLSLRLSFASPWLPGAQRLAGGGLVSA